MRTTCQFKLKIKICVTKSKKLKSEVAVRKNIKNRCQKTGKLTEIKNMYRLVSKTETMYVK